MKTCADLIVQRINDDSSWLVRWSGLTFLLDPWLLGDDINFASWFSRQWLSTPPLHVDDLPALDFILVSHQFSDHCSAATLRQLPPLLPVYAAPAAAKKIRQLQHFEQVESLQDWQASGETRRVGPLTISFFAGAGALDFTHNALLLQAQDSDKSVLYCPHGFGVPTSPRLRALLESVRPTLLLTTFRRYRLPWWLGGPVNLGAEDSIRLAQMVRPQHLIRTHDAAKHEAGIVRRIASGYTHPDPQQALLAGGATARYHQLAVGESLAL